MSVNWTFPYNISIYLIVESNSWYIRARRYKRILDINTPKGLKTNGILPLSDKKFDINQIQVPGYITIRSGAYFSFHDYGARGPVYITIKTPGKFGLETLHYNVQVGNDQSVLVDKEGYLLNVLYGKIWTDISGKRHKDPYSKNSWCNIFYF